MLLFAAEQRYKKINSIFSETKVFFSGGFKFEAQRALKIDGTPLKVFCIQVFSSVCYLICFESL